VRAGIGAQLNEACETQQVESGVDYESIASSLLLVFVLYRYFLQKQRLSINHAGRTVPVFRCLSIAGGLRSTTNAVLPFNAISSMERQKA